MLRFRLPCLLVVCVLSLPMRSPGQVSGYEWVTQGGRNNLVDSNPTSCDNSPFNAGTGVWSAPGQGCYGRTGAPCSADPGRMCDLQVVPAGRCSYGSLSATGGPGGTNTCVWPHGAGRCNGNNHVGCLNDAMCAGTVGLLHTCDLGTDPYGGPFRADCTCDGENAAAANFETVVCGTVGDVKALCSDGDPDRDRGGYGLALGIEVSLAPGNPVLLGLGPTVNGSSGPSTSPRYPLENPPSQIEPQRPAGTVNRSAFTLGAVHRVRTTEARESSVLDAILGVFKQRGFGDSYWADWAFESQVVTGTFNTHSLLLACDAPVGWTPDTKIDPTPAVPNSGDERYCSQLGRDSLALVFSRGLTPAERDANPSCPPSCNKDFDLTTTELEAIDIVAGLDANAGAQLALQSGEGRAAGAGDVISATRLTLAEWLNTNDGRCRLGGWGNAAGFIGRCADGPTACVPGDPANGDSLCATQGGQCRACNGPINAGNADLANGQPNNLGLPPGYNPHGIAALDLVVGQRIGFIAGVPSVIRLPLFFVGTTGYAAAEFRDLPGTGVTLDLADLGEIDPAGAAFAIGIGAGGTFANGVPLPIGESCCANGSSIVWAPANVGTALTTLLRTFDAGPGPDGIPGCIGDNLQFSNGLNACNQRLGLGNIGAKTDGLFNTGRDDIAETFPVGASGVIPASSARFGAGLAGISAVTPAFNLATALAFRDRSIFGTANTDGLVKLDVSLCPILAGTYNCLEVDVGFDSDGDGVPDLGDNCPTVANASQLDADADFVGDACDNCVNRANPRPVGCFTSATCDQWATLTGGQRDDDHDGYGNRCDAKFVGSRLVGALDLAQMRASSNQARSGDTCGTSQARPCAIFDLDESDALIGTGDLTVFRALNNKLPGPKCASCPLPCTAGTAGTCGPIPP